MDILPTVEKLEQAVPQWRDARDEGAQDQRVANEIARVDTDRYQRFGYHLTQVETRAMRDELLQQERTKAAKLEAEVVDLYGASGREILQAREASETLQPRGKAAGLYVDSQRALDTAELADARTLIREASVEALLKRFRQSKDDTHWAFCAALEEAVTMGVEKFAGRTMDQATDFAAAALKQAIIQRRQARWPSWTHEAETRLKAAMSVSDDALLRLKRMRAIS
jgi:hypothetical protein